MMNFFSIPQEMHRKNRHYKADRFASVKEPNPAFRYRNVHISLAEIIQANRQDLHEAE